VALSQPAARTCEGCGAHLARDNSDTRCSTCRRGSALKPPVVPREFWDFPGMKAALDSWHIGRVILAYRHHPWHGREISQEVVGGWLGGLKKPLTQPQMSRIENGLATEDLRRLVPWARMLGIPGELLWFKLPDETRGLSPALSSSRGNPRSTAPRGSGRADREAGDAAEPEPGIWWGSRELPDADQRAPAGMSGRSALRPSWPSTAAEAKRDAAQLWSLGIDDRGTPAGHASAAASVILSWLTAPSDGITAQSVGGAEVCLQDVRRVRAIRARLKEIDNAHGGGTAFPLAAAYLRDEAVALLQGSFGQETGAALLGAIAEAELDAGWFAYDAGDHQLARLYMIHALRMAHASGSRLLGARIVCALSHQALHVGQVSLSVDMARAAGKGIGAEATPRATAMLAAMEAMAHAAARDPARCEQALDSAERALTRATVDDGDPDWLDFDEGGLLGHRARALRDLSAAGLATPRHARQSAQQSAELCRADHSRTRAQRHAILATTLIQDGDLSHAAAIGELVVADAWGLRSRHVQADVAALLAIIEPVRSRSARSFTEQARELLAHARPPHDGSLLMQ